MPVNTSTWGVAYYDDTDFLICTKVLVAKDYMDACKRALTLRPRRAEDFHLVDVDPQGPFPEGSDVFNGSHDFIAAAAQAFKEEIAQRRLEFLAQLAVDEAVYCQQKIAARGSRSR